MTRSSKPARPSSAKVGTSGSLGARADRDDAVARIFAAKGRPADHPLIVHVPNQAAALYFVTTFPPVAQRLVEAFWPGPLTVIVPRHPDMARAAAGGQDTIGLRCPDHPVARQLLDACAQKDILGIAAPSVCEAPQVEREGSRDEQNHSASPKEVSPDPTHGRRE